MDAMHVSVAGISAAARAAHILEVAERLARRVADPHVSAMVALAKALLEFFVGRWRRSTELCDQAEGVFRERCTGVAWEIDSAVAFALWSLLYMGELKELARRRPPLLQEARERGSLYAVANLSTDIMAAVRLAEDKPEEARQELREVMDQWSRREFYYQHHNAVVAQAQIDLYTGRYQAAWEYVEQQWPGYAASQMLRIQVLRIEALLLRARSALGAAAVAAAPERLLRAVEKDARRLEKEGTPWANNDAHLLRAGVACIRRDQPGAGRLLAAVASGFDECDMPLSAAAARRRLGKLLGGEEGRALVTQADAWMSGQRIRNPERMTAMMVPGFPD
jgi:hypothetical protein